MNREVCERNVLLKSVCPDCDEEMMSQFHTNMIFIDREVIIITNSMRANKTFLTLSEYGKISSVMKNLTREELLDLQHMIRYPSKTTVIKLENQLNKKAEGDD